MVLASFNVRFTTKTQRHKDTAKIVTGKFAISESAPACVLSAFVFLWFTSAPACQKAKHSQLTLGSPLRLSAPTTAASA
jgi:hypothetical protein